VNLFVDAEQPDTLIEVPMITNGGKYLSVARDIAQQITSGDAAYFDSNLNALRVGTVLSPVDDTIDQPDQP
jgi:hypothetical protein